MYDRILLPTDGSEGADRAFDHAFGLAETYDAELHVLFAVDTSAFASVVDATLVADELERYGERVVAEVVERARDAGVERVQSAVVSGAAHRVILDYAEANDVDLVVMGTHGRRGLDRYLLGSVTEQVVRLSDAPVLTVRGSEESE